MTLRSATLVTSLLLDLILLVYLGQLVVRTAYFARSAAVGIDVALGVAILCAAAVALSGFAVYLWNESPGLPRLALALSLSLAVCYFLLFIAGKFGPVSLK